MSRPLTYTVAAILMVLYCLIDLTMTIPTLALGSLPPDADAPPFFLTLLTFGLDLLGIVGAYGVWRMQKWGVLLTITVAALAALAALPAIIFAPTPLRFVSGLGLVWNITIIVLLLRRTPTPATA